MKIKPEIYKYGAGALLALFLSVLGAWLSRETKFRKELTQAETKRDEWKSLAESSAKENETLKAQVKSQANTSHRSRVETRPDGTRIEELEESSQFLSEMLVQTTREYEARLAEAESKVLDLENKLATVEVKTVVPGFKPWAWEVGQNMAGKETGNADAGVGYHLNLGGFDVGVHGSTPIAGPKALLPPDERPYRFSIQGRI